MIETGINNIIKTGMMKDLWKYLKRIAIGDRTWLRWKTHLNDAFAELKELNEITAQKAGFGDHAMEARGYIISEEIKDAIENLAFAEMTNNDIVEELTHDNARLTDTVLSLQGDNFKLVTIFVLCKPTNLGGVGYDKPDW